MKALLRFHFREREEDGLSAPAHTDVEATESTPIWLSDVIEKDQVLISVELLLEKDE